MNQELNDEKLIYLRHKEFLQTAMEILNNAMNEKDSVSSRIWLYNLNGYLGGGIKVMGQMAGEVSEKEKSL